MEKTPNIEGNRSWLLAPGFIGSEQFTVTVASLLTLVGLSAPLLLNCYRHLSLGHLGIGCSFGTLGLVVTGVSVWKLSASLRRAKHRYSVHGPTDTIRR